MFLLKRKKLEARISTNHPVHFTCLASIFDGSINMLLGNMSCDDRSIYYVSTKEKYVLLCLCVSGV